MRDVSIIIPTYNRPEDLYKVLPYYISQKYVKEIVIVDDGSNFSYKKVTERYQNLKEIKFIYKRNKVNLGAAASRNVGVEISTGKYILWGEDDAFLSDDYVEVLRNKMNNKTILFGSIYYGITPDMDPKERNRIIMNERRGHYLLFDYDTFEGYYRLLVDDCVVPFGHALVLAPRESYNDISFFEGYKVNGYREESDGQVQMTKNGYKIVYTSDTCCYHFPSKNKSGGQHSSNLIKFELYKIINNNIFLNRHYDFLKKKYGIKHSITEIKLIYIYYTLCSFTKRAIRKVLKILVKS